MRESRKWRKCMCERVCARVRERERTMDDIFYNCKPNLLGEQWMIYELILHPYIVKTITNIFNIFTNLCVRTRAQICTLGLGPYLMIWICPKRSKWLKKLQDGGSRTERVEEYSPRRLSFSDRINIDQASTWATWVTFQECPTIRMNLKHVQRR